MTLLEVLGLSKSFGALRANDGISLTLEPREIHALIGPNGAGKTTLIAQLAGELRPDAGRVLLRGQDVTGLPVHARVRRGLARSFQVSSSLRPFTVLANVALACQARTGHSFRFWRPAAGDPALDGPAMALLEEVGLAMAAAVPAGELSHGDRRVLEIALALATGAEALLLDEPMAGIGQEESGRMIALLHRLKDRHGILLVEHDMAAVFSLADRISVLVEGRVIASGSPAAVRADLEVQRAYLGDGEDEPG